MKVLKTEPVTMSEAKEIMKKIEKGKELSYEQKLAMDYLNKISHMKASEAQKCKEELSLVLRMSPESLIQLVNLLPQTPDEVRMIFSREKFSLKEDEIKKIMGITKKYR